MELVMIIAAIAMGFKPIAMEKATRKIKKAISVARINII